VERFLDGHLGTQPADGKLWDETMRKVEEGADPPSA